MFIGNGTFPTKCCTNSQHLVLTLAFFAMQAEIAELLGGRDRFDPEILTPRLEAYVEEQVAAALRPCAPCRAPPAGVFFGNGARPC